MPPKNFDPRCKARAKSGKRWRGRRYRGRPVLFPRLSQQGFRVGPDRGQEQAPCGGRKPGSAAGLRQCASRAGDDGSVDRGCLRRQEIPPDRGRPGAPPEPAVACHRKSGFRAEHGRVRQAVSAVGGQTQWPWRRPRVGCQPTPQASPEGLAGSLRWDWGASRPRTGWNNKAIR
jgi:hypothetical protein